MHTAEPLIPDPSVFEVEISIEKLKRYKSPLIKFWQKLSKQEEIYYVLRSVNLVSLSGIRKSCHSTGGNLFSYLFMKKVIKLTVVIIKEYYCYQLHTKFYPLFFSQC